MKPQLADYIDIGNTRLKYASATQPYRVNYSTHDNLTDLTTHLKHSQGIIFVTAGRSVSSQKALAQVLTIATLLKRDLELLCTQPKWLTVNYDDPTQFGVDRFLGLLASRDFYKTPFCVISVGTAITLDFYTNTHIGGMILPGLDSAKDLLATRTGLDTIKMPDTLLGDDTASSIGAGIYIGSQNLITRSIERVSAAEKTTFHKIWTGGDAQLLYDGDGDIIATLIFDGMRCYQDYLRQGETRKIYDNH